jgi:hypothetical protein
VGEGGNAPAGNTGSSARFEQLTAKPAASVKESTIPRGDRGDIFARMNAAIRIARRRQAA